MGNCCSCFKSSADKYGVAEEELTTSPIEAAGQQQYSWQMNRPDPKEYMFTDLKGEVKIKEPGSVGGQGFLIDNCEDCDLYIFDHMAQITIDDCTNCRIFLGPVSGSMFMRDCKGCKSVMVCRQFRTRDCHDCDILLMCSTRPIIESSSEMRFGCYDLPYRGLKEHLEAAKMNYFQNHWGHIYDFTPKDGNWTFLPESCYSRGLLPSLGEAPCVAEATDEDVPLMTLGDRAVGHESFLWALFPPNQADAALRFAREAGKEAKLLRTNSAALSKDQVVDIAREAKWDGEVMAKTYLGGRSVGVELVDVGDMGRVADMAKSAGAAVTTNEDPAASFRHLGIEG